MTTTNEKMADALDNIEALAQSFRDYLNGSGSAPDLLHEVSALTGNVNDLTEGLVQSARFSGYTWAEVGQALGTSRQAAQQRFGSEHTSGI